MIKNTPLEQVEHHKDRDIEIEKYFNKHGISEENIIIIAGNTFDSYFNEYPNSKLKITNGYIVLQQLSNKFNEYPRVGSLGYKSDYVNIGPSLGKHQMLCHPISPTEWINVSPSDTYNKHLKNSVIGDIV